MSFKFTSALAIMAVCLASLAPVSDAEAKRLGGGKSIGKSSQQSSQSAPAAAPNAASTAAPNAAAAAKPAAAAATPKPWGLLGGIAAGLGIAALASALGFGGGLANFLTGLLMAVAVVFVGMFLYRMFKRSSGNASPAFGGMQPAAAGATAGGAFSGIGSNTGSATGSPAAPTLGVPQNGASFKGFNADNTYTGGIGGEAYTPQRFEPQVNTAIPADFDVNGFLETAKKHYVRLQQAWDAGDLAQLKQFADDTVFAELKTQIEARGGIDKTEIVTLDARLLGITQGTTEYVANVEFAGMVREETFGSATPFREIWNLSKPVNGGGWLLVGIEQLSA